MAYRFSNGRTDERTHGQTDGRTDGRTDGPIILCPKFYLEAYHKNDHRVNIYHFRGGALLTAIFPDPRGLQITDNSFSADKNILYRNQ